MDQPRGAYAPVPTPLDQDLSFDAEAQAAHLRWLGSQGLDGALILGTNGEFPSFSLDERRAVAEAAAMAESGLDLILGVGSCAVPEALAMADTAASLGYGSILCPPPFYFRSAPVEGIAAFFLEVLNRSSLPVLLYHIPQVTGVPISDEILDLLDGHENLVGVKDSSGDLDELTRFTQRFSDGCYLVGNDRLLKASMDAGGAGSISAAASVAPSLVRAVQRGEADQASLDKVRALLEEYGLGPSVKALLRRFGFGSFETRSPLIGLDPESEPMLWATFCGLIEADRRPA
ncbi:MAG: dihydrodipicolinate synthase family protein [Acidobacteria bacterium]|jgi:4-hydroxy-tetrahydrodipicolinate synthase|nr:dihydrodipicolinate synthase family protein [Acidobacteriota bacterium]